ncbi:phosphatidylinositol glycan anchor biosynthesis class U protein-like [Ostrea edulis]|uniref:phosphatidylinositol glycan anchor biosynthesis class U protein-like n=1 Tax=Ostrea edulis TaxID=37623 RepID=UPI0024AEE7CD|nr:phosphatidylinositol glycan anchor biosynthesis class U protein-like [Ostrea edulis]
MVLPTVISFVAGVVLRLALFRSSLPEWLSTKREVVTPITSWGRAMEGLALHKEGISPYSGDIFHESPLMLKILGFITRFSPNTINLIFVALDIIQGMILLRIANQFGRHELLRQASRVKNFHPDAKKFLLRKEDLFDLQFYITVAFSFNPYSVATCLAKSTAVFNNIVILLALYYMLKGNPILSSVFVALAAYISMYPIILCVPVAVYSILMSTKGRVIYTDSAALFGYLQIVCITFISLAIMLLFSMLFVGSWEFIPSTYGFILGVPDLTPNLGLFWYFFTEMFEHFRTFFICVFQINAVIYTIPLAIRLREHPSFLFYMLLYTVGIFKSYPGYGDVGLVITLLPLWKHIKSYMRNTFVTVCMFLVTTVFAPIQYYLWIYAGSANANFYFAISLAFSTAQILMATDLLFAFLKREFFLHNGDKHKLPDGTDAQIILDS